MMRDSVQGDEVAGQQYTRPATISPSTRRIIREAAMVFGISEQDLVGTARFRTAVLARRACLAILVTRMGWSCSRAGKSVNRDHTTVLHALRRYKSVDDLDFLRKVWLVVERSRVTRAIVPIQVPVVEPEATPPKEPSNSAEKSTDEGVFEIMRANRKQRYSYEDPLSAQIYVEARIPPEVDAEFLKALRREGTPPPDVIDRREHRRHGLKLIGAGAR